MPRTYVNFHAPINLQTAQNLMAAVSQRFAQGTNEFYFLFSTPGGQVGLAQTNVSRASEGLCASSSWAARWRRKSSWRGGAISDAACITDLS